MHTYTFIIFFTYTLFASNCALQLTGSEEPPSLQDDMVCPMVFDPVCAAKDGEEKTYSNSCEALKVGAEVVHKGAC